MRRSAGRLLQQLRLAARPRFSEAATDSSSRIPSRHPAQSLPAWTWRSFARAVATEHVPMYITPQSDFDIAAATIAGVSARVVQSLNVLASSDAGVRLDFPESLRPPLQQHLRASALFSTFDDWASSEERRLGGLLQLLSRLLLESEPAGSPPAHRLFLDFVVSQAAVPLTESALYR